MKITEIMTPRPETIRPDATIREAADKMRVLDIGFLAVCNGDKILGTVTDRDITVRHVAFGLEPRETQVREVMSTDVFYCFDDQDVDEVGQAMAEKEVKRMLILNKDKKLVGVVSLGDISKARGEQELAGETLKDISEAA